MVDTSALSTFIEQLESELKDRKEMAAISPGASNLVRHRNTKAGRRDFPIEVLTMRSASSVLVTRGSDQADIHEQTTKFGAFSVAIGPFENTVVHADLVFCENIEVFWEWERVQPTNGAICFKSGVASNRQLDWLDSTRMRSRKILLAVDFDPVGLLEYIRFKTKLGADRVSMHIPRNLDDLFRLLSNKKLLRKRLNVEKLGQARSVAIAHPEVVPILKLIEKYRAGLEHEAILTENTSNKLGTLN